MFLEGLALLPLDGAVLDEAASIDPADLRSLDALHLATALSVRSDRCFRHLRRAAGCRRRPWPVRLSAALSELTDYPGISAPEPNFWGEEVLVSRIKGSCRRSIRGVQTRSASASVQKANPPRGGGAKSTGLPRGEPAGLPPGSTDTTWL